jgi:hypothetical protein
MWYNHIVRIKTLYPAPFLFMPQQAWSNFWRVVFLIINLLPCPRKDAADLSKFGCIHTLKSLHGHPWIKTKVHISTYWKSMPFLLHSPASLMSVKLTAASRSLNHIKANKMLLTGKPVSCWSEPKDATIEIWEIDCHSGEESNGESSTTTLDSATRIWGDLV